MAGFSPQPRVPDTRSLPAGMEAEGTGHFPSFLRQSSLADTRYASLRSHRNENKWLPSLPRQYMSIHPKTFVTHTSLSTGF
jgi:hypothetical protein